MDKSMENVYWLAGMILIVLLSGCGGGKSVMSTTSTTSAVLLQQTQQFGSLQFSLVTDKTSYALGEPVQLTFTVKNVGAQAVEYIISMVIDAKVTRGSRMMWQLSKTGGSGGGFLLQSLEPGESRIWQFTWDQKDLRGNLVRPGKYTMKAWFIAIQIDGVDILPGEQESKLAAPPVTFRIQRQ